MVRYLLFCSLLVLLCSGSMLAQSEIDWSVKVNTDQMTQTDKRILTELESQIVQFLEGITWTDDRFLPEERIEATIFFTLSEVFEESNKGGGASVVVPDVYKATVAVQSSRPIYGTSEKTPVFNFQDRFVQFQYQRGKAFSTVNKATRAIYRIFWLSIPTWSWVLITTPFPKRGVSPFS
jgi:hypothetical protein